MKPILSFPLHLFLLFLLVANLSSAQTVTYDPAFPRPDQQVTLTVNVKGTSLEGYSGKVWIWSWIDNPTVDFDAPTNVNPATTPGQDAALMTRSASDPDVYSITFTPAVFYSKPAADINRIGFKLKSISWDDNKQSDNDLFVDFFKSGFSAKLISPIKENNVLKTNENLKIEVVTSEAADKIELFIGTTLIKSVVGDDMLSYIYSSTTTKDVLVKIIASKGGAEDEVFEFSITSIDVSGTAERPAGIKDGINYIDDQTVVLSLLAPLKEYVIVIGDFTDWKVNSMYKMHKTPDGERYWIELPKLTKGTEYGFQYLVDGKIRIADPYADKILDPDDHWIPNTTYPDLKPFPDKANYGEWFEKRVSVVQTGQESYPWQVKNFAAPEKEELVIYELLIRDFFSADKRNYQNLIDTLSYLKRSGINAIELMPITEFNGNDSWGYNPTFMLAVDKAYGTKNKLKEFIDEAHKAGIAVILDIVLNQQDRPNPYLEMYWEGNAPAANSPMFNRTAKHPFNVFSDMNHESKYTKAYVDTVVSYWLNEYKFDGLRFDLSKGFTQNDNLNNEAGWNAYDASRIALLKRIAERIWTYKPNAYVILEHLGGDEEEKELADAGMMPWGNMHGVYEAAASGKAANLSRSYYKNKGWEKNNLVTYMESHDEERIMYAALNSGLANGSYNIKTLSTALDRMKLNATFFFMIPGPKLFWQFGELGYDISIKQCTDGSLSTDCRLSSKPVLWEYKQEASRANLFKVYQKLMALRNTEAFKKGTFEMEGAEQVKSINIAHSSMDIVVFGNFSTAGVAFNPSFPSEGKWYDYLSGDSIQVMIKDAELSLAPGEFHVYTSKRITKTNEGIVPFESDIILATEGELSFEKVYVFPNPGTGSFKIKGDIGLAEITIYDIAGKSIAYDKALLRKTGRMTIDGVRPGLYLIEIREGKKVRKFKIIKE